MSVDANAMLERFKELNENKKFKEETEKRQKAQKIDGELEDAFARLDDVLKEDGLFGLQEIYWFLHENGATFEHGDGTEKRYFTYIQDSNLTSHENNIYFHPVKFTSNVKMCEYHDISYLVDDVMYQSRAEIVMQLNYDGDGGYKVIFNSYFKQVNEPHSCWHKLRDNNEQTKIIKTKMLNNFCDRLPEFVDEVEGVFKEYMHDQELQYGDEKQIKELKLDDFAKAYELYCEKLDGYFEPFSPEELEEKGEIHLWEVQDDNIIYEANYDVNEEKLKYYKRGDLLSEEDYSIGDITNEIMKAYDDGVETTHYFDALYYNINDNLKFIDTCDTFLLCENDEYFWNEEKTRLFKCYAPLSENEKSLLLENADRENIFDENVLVHIVYDAYKNDENVLFDIVKQYSERPDVMKTSSYEAMANKLKQGVKM